MMVFCVSFLFSAALSLFPAPVQSEGDGLADAWVSERHECSFRPPAGWEASSKRGNAVVRFVGPKGEAEISPYVQLIYVSAQAPHTPAHYGKLLDERLKRVYPDHRVRREGAELEIAGMPGYLKSVEVKTENGAEVVMVKSAAMPDPMSLYLVEGLFPLSQAEQWEASLMRSIESFRLVPYEETEDDLARTGRFASWAAGLKAFPEGYQGEWWQTFRLRDRKIGYRMHSLKPGEDGLVYTLEIKILGDDGGSQVVRAHGVFSPDGKRQTIEKEMIFVDEGERAVHRERVTLADGKARQEWEVRGEKLVREKAIPPGTVLSEVGDFFRALASTAGEAELQMRVLPPFSTSFERERMDVLPGEQTGQGDKRMTVHLVQSRIGGGRVDTYWYAPDRRLVRWIKAGGGFTIEETTREEALEGMD